MNYVLRMKIWTSYMLVSTKYQSYKSRSKNNKLWLNIDFAQQIKKIYANSFYGKSFQK